MVSITARGSVAAAATIAAVKASLESVFLAVRIYKANATLSQTTVCFCMVCGVELYRCNLYVGFVWSPRQ